MSKCEHNDKISLFCVTETCNWKEAGGCQLCIKKYHNHILKPKIIGIQEMNKIIQKVNFGEDVKAKCRAYQESIYNYLTFIKQQLASSIDSLWISMMNRVGSPLINQKGYITLYKKLKAADYKKISSKNLLQFIHFAKNSDSIQNQQKALYHQQAQYAFEIISLVNQNIKNFESAFKNYQIQFENSKNQYKKIMQINNERKSIYGSNNNTTRKRVNQEKKDKQVESSIKYRSNSIGYSVEEQKSISTKYDEQEREILSRKQKLLEIMNKNKQPINKNSMENKTLVPPKSQRPRKISFVQQTLNSQDNKQSSQQKYKGNLFDFLLTKGINLPQIILAQTHIPESPEKEKSYQCKENVQNITITIPLSPLVEQQQPQSPLLKKRKNLNKEFSLALKKTSYIQQTVSQNHSVQNAEESVTVDPKCQIQKQQVIEQNCKDNLIAKITPQSLVKQKIQVKEEPKLQLQIQQKSSQKNIPQQIIKLQKQNLNIQSNQTNSLVLLLKALPMRSIEAIPLLQAALSQSKNNLSAAEYLSYLYLENNRPKQCLDLCNQFLDIIQNSPNYDQLSIHLNNNKAAALNILGRYSEAIPILNRCLVHLQKDILYKNLGDAYFYLGIIEQAQINYEKAVNLNQQLDEAYYNLAVCMYHEKKYNQSKQAVQKALMLCPNNQNYIQLDKHASIALSLNV